MQILLTQMAAACIRKRRRGHKDVFDFEGGEVQREGGVKEKKKNICCEWCCCNKTNAERSNGRGITKDGNRVSGPINQS